MRPLRAAGLPHSVADEGGASGLSYDAQAEAIETQFLRQLDGLHRRFRPWEIPGVVRALQDNRRLSLRLLRERQEMERYADRQARKRQAPPPPPPSPPPPKP